MRLAFISDGARPLSSLGEGVRGVVASVRERRGRDSDRLMALGVTAGAAVTVLQTFPGVVFLCDQTELVVEREVAKTIFVTVEENRR